jgi:hypothetical protein
MGGTRGEPSSARERRFGCLDFRVEVFVNHYVPHSIRALVVEREHADQSKSALDLEHEVVARRK